MRYARSALTASLVLAGVVQAQAQTQTEAPKLEFSSLYQEVLVTGGREAIRTLPGSASFVDEEAIEQFDITDLHDLLTQVPGVYIRFEDGYGLRPNIGIRGATSERSQKITLMEDGILIAPAPYSAPAAYYLPNVSRMSAVEVFKGPASIHYGPHTVGGALNMVTQPVPTTQTGELSLTYGDDHYHKGRLFYGDSGAQFGYWVDALRYGADGFKELDGGGDTGFERNDINAKLQWRSRPGAAIAQRLELKLGYADEVSDETYLGLTEADFAANPVRRYAASARDEFTSEHTQVHALHRVDFVGSLSLTTRAYVNRFDREWDKFDGFFPAELAPEEDPYRNRLSAAQIFEYADSFPTRLALLRGEVDSDGSLEQTLDITNNARQYGSQGIEVSADYELGMGAFQHKLEAGLRFHHDYVERDHRARGYWMQGGELVFDGVADRPKKALNKAETDAWALYISDQISYGDWRVNLGVRSERIEGELDNHLTDSLQSNTETVVIPGAGIFYQFTDELGLLLGVNKGFSPSGPGASDEVEPEESVNYEYGLRYRQGDLSLDAIGFFSDYSNLLGRCRVSDSGCEVGDEFNGGSVEVAGLELTAGYAWQLGNLSLPLDLVYTYTETAFQSDFNSGFSQWGLVRSGDELPYLPKHQGRLLTGLQGSRWALHLALDYHGAMRDEPGQGVYLEGETTEAFLTLDLALRYDLSDELSLQLVGENLTDELEVVSRKPFGARPNQPRSVKLGASYRF